MKELEYKITKQTAEAASERVPPQLQEDFERTISAGLDNLFSGETSKMVEEQMKKEGDKFALLGEGCAGIAIIVWSTSDGKMPLRIIIPAGVVITCHALELFQDATGQEITNDGLGEAVSSFMSTFLQQIGATPEKLEGMMAGGEAPEGAEAAAAQLEQMQGGGEPPMEPALDPQGPPAGIVGNNMGV